MVATAKLKDTEELIANLSEVLEKIKYNDEKADRIKRELKRFNIFPGTVQQVINNTEMLKTEERPFLYLFTNSVYIASGDASIHPDDYFKPREIKEILTNYKGEVEKQIKFPFTFSNVIKGSDDDFMCYVSGNIIKDLYENQLLQYNTETQRETRQKYNSKKEEYVPQIKVIEKSVKEIVKLIEEDELISSVLTFNARLGSADDGNEITYNESSMSLTINEGTLLDALDGYHRITGVVRALRLYPDRELQFKVNILNYDTNRAKAFFAQLNTVNPIDKGHLSEMSKKTFGTTFLDYVKYNSELKGFISPSSNISNLSRFIVSKKVLIESFDEVFNSKDRPEAIEHSTYLANFFNKLIWTYPKAFMSEIVETREKSIINANSIFYGYVMLAKRLKDENIDLDKLPKILSEIDFSRENKLWKELGIINDSLTITNRAKQQFYKFFNEIKLK